MNRAPILEIISTGTEILQGLYADAHACRLSRRVEALGFRVAYHHAVGDSPGELEALLRWICRRCNGIVVTGGLGPTEDDVTRDAIARVWEAPPRLDVKSEQMMRARFESRKIVMPERNIVQAMIPEGATVFYNDNGTAPGFAIPPANAAGREAGEREASHCRAGEQQAGEYGAGECEVGELGAGECGAGECEASERESAKAFASRAAILALPGPSSEWVPMWDRAAAWLCEQFPWRPRRALAAFHTAMAPESFVNQKLQDLFHSDPRIEATILAKRGHVRLRFIATAPTDEEAREIAEAAKKEALSRLPPEIILSSSAPEWSLEEELGVLLADGKRTIATAESCTGGLIAAQITSIPGASRYFRQGFVVYANEAKTERLGVAPEILEKHGAVSRECALAMARGARELAGASAAVAVSGIAGPGGGTPEKPVGTLWLALDSAGRPPAAFHRYYLGDRENIREWACRQALDLLRRWAAGLPWPPEQG